VVKLPYCYADTFLGPVAAVFAVVNHAFAHRTTQAKPKMSRNDRLAEFRQRSNSGPSAKAAELATASDVQDNSPALSAGNSSCDARKPPAREVRVVQSAPAQAGRKLPHTSVEAGAGSRHADVARALEATEAGMEARLMQRLEKRMMAEMVKKQQQQQQQQQEKLLEQQQQQQQQKQQKQRRQEMPPSDVHSARPSSEHFAVSFA